MSAQPAGEYACALIVAAGQSLRMGGADKLFAPLGGHPLLFHTLQPFQRSPLVHAITLVLSAENLPQGRALLERYGWGKVHGVCTGGERRQDSVRQGLLSLPPCDWVIVHDGARPCVTEDLLEQGLAAAQGSGAAVPMTPVQDTVKQLDSDSFVIGTIPRETLGLAQTPQVFRYDLLLHAHQTVTADVTDDAALVELLGYPVKAFPGASSNIKVTTPDDLALAEALLARHRPLASAPQRPT